MVALDRSFLSLRFPLGDCMPKVILCQGDWMVVITQASWTTVSAVFSHLLSARKQKRPLNLSLADPESLLLLSSVHPVGLQQRQDLVCPRNVYSHRSVKIPYSKIENLDRSLLVEKLIWWKYRSSLKVITSEVDGISFPGLSCAPFFTPPSVFLLGSRSGHCDPGSCVSCPLSCLSPWALGLFAQGRSRFGLKLSFP